MDEQTIKLRESIDLDNLPVHIAVIMDGNGRWAKSKGAKRVFGHQNAIKAVREITEESAKLGIQHLTLYAFSRENWSRPKTEVNALMRLLIKTMKKETETLNKNNIRFSVIGDIHNLPQECQKEVQECISNTKNNTGLKLFLALSYSGRWDIVEAAKQIALEINNKNMRIDQVTEDSFAQYLQTKNCPDPELLIRTSGEMRISNFLLWQLAYTEIYITDILWPDFRRKNLYDAIVDFQQRERRFGKTSEQLKNS